MSGWIPVQRRTDEQVREGTRVALRAEDAMWEKLRAADELSVAGRPEPQQEPEETGEERDDGTPR